MIICVECLFLITFLHISLSLLLLLLFLFENIKQVTRSSHLLILNNKLDCTINIFLFIPPNAIYIYHRRRKRGGGGGGGGGGGCVCQRGACPRHLFDWGVGGNGMFVPPPPHFLTHIFIFHLNYMFI